MRRVPRHPHASCAPNVEAKLRRGQVRVMAKPSQINVPRRCASQCLGRSICNRRKKVANQCPVAVHIVRVLRDGLANVLAFNRERI